MTEPNDKSLDEYLQRDSLLSRHYRELESDAVPPEIDARVLAEARAAIASPRRSRPAWVRWSAPLALAASAVLVVAIVLETGVDERVAVPQARVTESSKGAAATVEQPAAPPPSPAEAEAQGGDAALDTSTLQQYAEPEVQQSDRKQSESPREAERTVARTETVPSTAAAPAVAAPQPFRNETPPATMIRAAPARTPSAPAAEARAADASSPAAVDEIAVTSMQRKREDRSFGPRAPVAPVAQGAVDQDAPHANELAKAAERDPEQWLDEIRELRKAGQQARADEQWRLFSEAFPAFDVAPSDAARPR